MHADELLARVAAEAARQLHRSTDPDTTLTTIVQVARATLDGVDEVSVSLAGADGSLATMASTSEVIDELDRTQSRLAEGPCLHAALAEQTVVVQNIPHEQRWPGYIQEAARRGLRSQVGLRLYLGSEKMGALNLYSFAEQKIPPETVELAELFAANAAIALGGVRERANLSAAVETRESIGLAVGIVMERFGLDETRAFEYLSRVSQHSNVKLRDVARRVVEDGDALGARPEGQ